METEAEVAVMRPYAKELQQSLAAVRSWRGRKDPPSEPAEGTGPAITFISDSGLQKRERIDFCFHVHTCTRARTHAPPLAPGECG